MNGTHGSAVASLFKQPKAAHAAAAAQPDLEEEALAVGEAPRPDVDVRIRYDSAARMAGR